VHAFQMLYVCKMVLTESIMQNGLHSESIMCVQSDVFLLSQSCVCRMVFHSESIMCMQSDVFRQFSSHSIICMRKGAILTQHVRAEWCEKLQSRLSEATLMESSCARTPTRGEVPFIGGSMSPALLLCKNLPSSQRSDTAQQPPQLAKKLPSPLHSHRRLAETAVQSAPRQPAVIAVTRPKEHSWFDSPTVGWLARSNYNTPEKAPESRWFGSANPLDMLGINIKQGLGTLADTGTRAAEPPENI
jgi:hypothetical protein